MAPPPVDSVLSLQQHEGVIAEEAYWLVQPYAYVAILQNREKERTYLIVEPELSTRERIILEETHETLRDVLIYDKPVGKGDLVLEFGEVAKVVTSYDPKIPEERLHVLFYYLQRNLSGYGKIDPLMHDELLEDISCNGHDIPVFVHHRLYGSMPTTIQFGGEELNRYVLKLSQKADKQVSLTSPLLDAALPNGSRAQITYSDIISTKGSSFTIRKFRTDPMTPATLLSFNTYNPELMAFLWLALENRKSLIVVGGTASGKTSAMNAFSFFIPHNSKIVSLEDTREIQIPHKNWLPVQTRQASSMTDRGTIDLFDLLKASLRQRPEYIIVGEVRGSEAQTLFQAMNSGHTTLSTLHAGTIEEALNRLTNEPINVPAAMFGALDLIIVQTFHYREGRMIRRCDAIHEILLSEGGHLRWNTLYEYNPAEDGFLRKFTHSETLRAIQYMHNWDDAELQYQLDLRKEFLTRFKFKSSSDPRILMRMITDLRRLS
ncbi:MAG: type II/IV secretion system ATPase subunit [Methanospirillaceae archaeon]|nr:type II/IV secretion system ATPase subunit [Methanospirillaceae archaeon]